MPVWTPATATPGDSRTPMLWLRADSLCYSDAGTTLVTADGSAVYDWHCKATGSTRAFRQATAGARPTLKTNIVDGHSVLRFDGGDKLVSIEAASVWKGLHDGTGVTVFIVAKTADANPNRLQVLLDTGGVLSSQTGLMVGFDDRVAVPRESKVVTFVGNGSALAAGLSADYAAINQRWHILRTAVASTSFVTTTDGRAGDIVTLSFTKSTNNPTATLTIGDETGNLGTFELNGDIAEILIYPYILTLADIATVGTYLANRYQSAIYADTQSELVKTTVITGTVDGNDHHAFPSVLQASNGDLLAFFRSATEHQLQGVGRISYRKSTDRGATWSTSTDLLTPASGKNWQEVNAIRLRYGTYADRIVVACTRTNNVNGQNLAQDDWCLYSDDHGTTWNTASPVQISASTLTGFSRVGCPVQRDNGDILLPVYGKDSADGDNWTVELLKSTDGGATWSLVSTIADGVTDSRIYNETGLAYYGSTLVAMVRDGIANGWRRFTSADHGETWAGGTLVINWSVGRPALTVDDRGHFYAVTRIVTTNITALIVSPDGGATWQRGDDFSTAATSVYGNCVHWPNTVGICYAQEAADAASIYWIQPIASNVAEATLTTSAQTLSASASHEPPTFTGAAALSASSQSLSASATHETPEYTAAAALQVSSHTVTASAMFDAGTFTATAALTPASQIVAASATFVGEAGTYTATANLTAASQILVSAAEMVGVVWPDPTDVRLGVVYGPTGADYEGELVAGSTSYFPGLLF